NRLSGMLPGRAEESEWNRRMVLQRRLGASTNRVDRWSLLHPDKPRQHGGLERRRSEPPADGGTADRPKDVAASPVSTDPGILGHVRHHPANAVSRRAGAGRVDGRND